MDAAARGTFSLGAACFIEASGPASEGGRGGLGGMEGEREGPETIGRQRSRSAGCLTGVKQ